MLRLASIVVLLAFAGPAAAQLQRPPDKPRMPDQVVYYLRWFDQLNARFRTPPPRADVAASVTLEEIRAMLERQAAVLVQTRRQAARPPFLPKECGALQTLYFRWLDAKMAELQPPIGPEAAKASEKLHAATEKAQADVQREYDALRGRYNPITQRR